MKLEGQYTLIGDIVESKKVKSRTDLQANLRRTLEGLSGDTPEGIDLSQRLEPTVGDEFQGIFGDLPGAVKASLLLRLEVLKSTGADSRYGIGSGPVTVFDRGRTPISQDGPGWWSARLAIETTKQLAGGRRNAFARTSYRSNVDDSGERWGEEAALNAFLIMRDAVVTDMKPKARAILLGLLLGKTQKQIAADEGVTQSNVSQTLGRSGAYAIQLAQEQLHRHLE